MNKLFKNFLLIFLLVFNGVAAVAQPYGHEWINFSQTYFKIKTAEDGLYRISYTDLQQAGFPVDIVDPRKIKMYHRGSEIAINFEGQLDARFDPADYLEFYGIKNDGTLDERLYVAPEAQPHQYHNLYSDTTAYFVTWSLNGTEGKRISEFKENNTTGIPAEAYHLDEKLILETNRYSPGRHYPLGQPSAQNSLAAFDYGEGWTGSLIRKGQSKDFTFKGLTNRNFAAGVPPHIELILAGGNNLDHKAEIYAGPSTASMRNVATAAFQYHDTEMVSADLQWTDISAAGELVIRVSVTGVSASPDFVSVSYVKLVYPEHLDQDNQAGKYFTLKENPENKSYIVVDNVQDGARLFDITDPSNIVLIEHNTTGNTLDAIVPATASARKLYITNELLSGFTVEKVAFRNFNPASFNYYIVTHPTLRKAGGAYTDVVEAYASYRASPAGGNFDTLTFDIGQLYDQFSYGEVTALALYNFAEFLYDKGDPGYLLLLGKALTPNYNSHRKDFASQAYADVVPTGGYPGSDAIFSVEIGSANKYPKIPTGRISATTSGEIAAYLDKVKEMESLEYNELWRKELVHLSGGGNASQQMIFRAFVDGFERVAENVYLGGQVITLSKKTNQETELINIAEQVNEGKALITFFGHSSSTVTDIEIGFVSNEALGYNNKGKYPAVLVNGCNAGDAYFTGYGFGLDWLLTPDKGAIAFIAHTNIGNSSTLKRYTDLFYEVGFSDSLYMEKGIGDIITEVSRRYLDRYVQTGLNLSQAREMALQGDPAVKLFGATAPDYETTADEIFVRPVDDQPVNVFTEKFDLGISVSNFGKALGDSLQVSVSRELANGTVLQSDTSKYTAVLYKDTLYFSISSAGIASFGINKFSITIDPGNKINELNELNNTVTFEYFIPLGGAINRYPGAFAILDTAKTILTAQSLDLLMGERVYLFEIDTSAAFNSPVKQSGSVNATVVAKWPVDLQALFNPPDSTVFYWRTKFSAPREGELDEWNVSSFTYIENGDEGWRMAHFPQFEAIKGDFVSANQTTRQWEFEQFSTRVSVKTFGADNPNYDYNNVELEVNGAPYIYPGQLCADNSINMVAFYKTTTTPYRGYDVPNTSNQSRRYCGRVPKVLNNFLNSEIILPDEFVKKYIDNVAEGDFVLMFSIGDVDYSAFPATTVAALENIGIDLADFAKLPDGAPFIALGKKGGAPGSAIFISGDPLSEIPLTEQEISLDETLTGTISDGTLTSPVVGPATAWGNLKFQLQTSAGDINSLEIVGIDGQNNETSLEAFASGNSFDIANIDAETYPNLKLRLRTQDETDLTPAQLKSWTVTYTGVPDGVLTYQGDPEEIKKVREGEEAKAIFSFENISGKNFRDSILVTRALALQNSTISFVDSFHIKPLKKWEKQDFELKINTLGKAGTSDLGVFVNPYRQMEKTYNNNLLYLEHFAEITPDETNPVLEVTFDGHFIMDGDIVAPSPQILIRVKDENPILFKKDTTGLELLLKRPCEGCDFERVSFSSPAVRWTPATEKSGFMVEYQPGKLQDGIYTLSVQATDETGNPAGAAPYRVNFEVVNESTVTNFFPYPNPFSTHVRFVFTLTGNELPDDLIIQIMTVAGTVVREITMDELGPLKIGNNLTQFAWDGKDRFGDQLANGVYLYRVKIVKDGSPMKMRATSADRAFKNGVGKIYLLR